MNADEFIGYILKGSNNITHIDNDGINFDDNDLISKFCQMLQKKYKLKLEKWTPNKKYYPNYMFLSGDRGILAYVSIRVVRNARNASFYNLSEIIHLVSKADSELDRPVFVITFVCDKKDKYFFFETNEEIKDRIFNDKTTCINNEYRIDKNCTGEINNFIEILKNIKK